MQSVFCLTHQKMCQQILAVLPNINWEINLIVRFSDTKSNTEYVSTTTAGVIILECNVQYKYIPYNYTTDEIPTV
jgi:hypothetical protein